MNIPSTQVHQCLVISILLTALISLSGCANGSLGVASPRGVGVNCVDDSEFCLAERRQALKEIMADKSMNWVDEKPTARSDASGVRLFAFKQRKRQLNCRQLGIGYREATSASGRLRSANSPALTPDLVSRGVILSDEVAKELQRELKRRRCRA